MSDVPAYAPLADDADLVKALADVVTEGRHLWYGDYKAQSEAELDAIRFIIDRTREAQRLLDQRQLRAAPREPGAPERIARMEAALKLAAKEFGRLWIAFDRGDSRRARVNELEQAMLDALAARPDAGDGTGETGAAPGGPHDG